MNIRKSTACAAIATGLVAGLAGAGPASAGPDGSVGTLASVNYRIEQFTGNVSDGGTDSTVRYRLCRGTVCTPGRVLDDPNKDDRERGNTDVYDREWENVGQLTRIEIHQATDGSAWWLERVRITYSGQTDTFLWGDWLPRNRWVSLPKA